MHYGRDVATDWRTVAQLLMSGVVLLAGLYVALVADASADLRFFGWVLVAVGVLGLAGTTLTRRRPGR